MEAGGNWSEISPSTTAFTSTDGAITPASCNASPAARIDSRCAAPTLNLFAAGFPVTMLMGFLVILMDIGSHGPIWQAQLTATFDAMGRLLAGH